MTAFKDANEHFKNDKTGFKENADSIEEKAMQKEKEKQEAALADYYKKSAGAKIIDFIDRATSKINTPYFATGFEELDKELDGGLFEGLYFIGAVSSLGKTTFCLQIADQLAEQGHDVLFFTLEQSEFELMAKSISRLTYKLCDSKEENAKTARGITTPSRYDNYKEPELDLITKAYSKYKTMAENKLYFIEGVGNVGVEKTEPQNSHENKETSQYIRDIVAEHVKRTGRKPVVIIDYIQILEPAEMRASDKQNTDRAVNALKRLSRDYKIPIIGISSFNRGNYNNAVSMESFKESGAIEYSSDILLGLQPAGMGKGSSGSETLEETKKSKVRKLELVILKNRNGRTGGKIEFDYHSLFNYFEETTGKFKTLTNEEQRENPFNPYKK